MSDLGTLGGSGSRASAMNERGEIVGWSDTTEISTSGAPVQHAFLWRDGAMLDLGTMGGPDSVAIGINSGGQIVGASSIPRAPSGVFVHGFLWDRGHMLDLNDMVPADNSFEIVEADCINTRGEIVALGREGFSKYALLRLRPTGR